MHPSFMRTTFTLTSLDDEPMNDLVKQQLKSNAPAIQRLCEACGVLRLEIFGSATEERFDPGCSDLDFLVSFRKGSAALDN